MSGFTGTFRLARLALRRDRITLPAWILGMAGFLAATTAMFEDSYAKHPQLLEPDTRIVVENPGMRVLGLVDRLECRGLHVAPGCSHLGRARGHDERACSCPAYPSVRGARS